MNLKSSSYILVTFALRSLLTGVHAGPSGVCMVVRHQQHARAGMGWAGEPVAIVSDPEGLLSMKPELILELGIQRVALYAWATCHVIHA